MIPAMGEQARKYLAALAIVLGFASAARAAEPPSAVILVYHRFGEERAASGMLRLDQFEAHLAELANGRYHVAPLSEIIAAFKSGRALPPRTVAVTLDGGFASAYRDAWPRLRAARLPMTVFISPDIADRGGDVFVGWDGLKEMLASGGVELGITTAQVLRADPRPEELARYGERLREKSGHRPRHFAYVGGEYTAKSQAAVAKAGFAAAFAQHQGVAYAGGDLYAIPRFAFAQGYGDLARFQRIANALPLPASDVTPIDTVIADNPPLVGFTVEDVKGLERLNCSASHVSGPLKVEILGDTRVEIRMDRPFPTGRGRMSCTLGGPDGRLRWFGMFFIAGGA
ncbi:MAG: chitin deacetylase [Alphaproteobacteria bacterium]|nr:chitin deacetylase [Alphaproteobacteria bacterium]